MKTIAWVWLTLMVIAGCARVVEVPTPSPTPLPPSHGTQATAMPVFPTATLPSEATATATAIPISTSTATPVLPDMRATALNTRVVPDLDLVRLPRYTVALTLTEPTAGMLVGRTAIHYTNNTGVPLPDVLLRLYPNTPGYNGALNIRTLSVDGDPSVTAFELSGTAMRIPLVKPLEPGEMVEILVAYDLQVPYHNRAGYGALNREAGVLTLGGFYPALAVFGPDGWQAELVTELGDPVHAEVALFDLTVNVPAGLTVIGSGHVLEQKQDAAGAAIWHLVGGPLRDFALVIGGSYTTVSCQVRDVNVSFAYYDVTDATLPAQVANRACNALEIYERLIGSYPYTELRIIQAPINASGLEYPGAILLGPRAFARGSEWLELVVAHETAHQWWYGLVGNDQVHQAWIDEGLASYSSILYFREQYGSEYAERVMKDYYRDPYTSTSLALQQMPANLSVTAYSESTYSPVVYIRSTNFFYELHQTFGERDFLQLLTQLQSHYSYEILREEDLLQMAQQFDPEQAVALYDYWILGHR